MPKKVKSTENKNKSKENKKILFGKEDVNDIVKGFIVNYIEGEVVVEFPLAEEQKNIAKARGKTITDKEAIDREVNSKISFTTLIETCCGTNNASPEQTEEAIAELFKRIINYRSAQRISGDFAKHSITNRIKNLEKGELYTKNVLELLLKDIETIKDDLDLLDRGMKR